MQEALESIPGESIAERLRLVDVFEMARRFSGLVAIVVLAATMIVLTVRAEPESRATPSLVTLAPAPQPAGVGVDTATSSHQSSTTVLHVDRPTTVYYLYDSEEQYDLVQVAESLVAQETASSYNGGPREFIALYVSTPEEEQAARDAIYEAMLANADGTKMIIVRDLRGLDEGATGE